MSSIKKIIKFAGKLIRGNWYVFQHQKDKIENEKKRFNKGKKNADKISESDIIRFLINNMTHYEDK